MAGETLVVQAQSMKPGQSTPAVNTAIMNADLGRRLLAEFVGTALLVIFGAGALVAALEMGQGELDYAGLGIVAISFALVVAAVDLHVRHDLGRAHQPGGHVLAGRGAAIPVGRGHPLRRRAARGRARRGGPHQRDLRVARERPQRLRRHDRRRGVHEGASGTSRRGSARSCSWRRSWRSRSTGVLRPGSRAS